MENSNTPTQTQDPPVTEMVERVARALCEASAVRSWDAAEPASRRALIEFARAAIAAMREPTEAMLRAGDETDDGAQGDNTMTSEACWAAMIDVALGERR